MDRPDESLGLAVVAKRLARRLHSTGQGGVGDQASVPHLLEELIPGHEPLVVLHEEGEKGEHLRLERAEYAFSAQFDLCQIQLEPSKPVFHGDKGRNEQGLRNALSGVTAAAVAIYAGRVLVDRNAFGNGYAATFAFRASCLLTNSLNSSTSVFSGQASYLM